MSGDARAPFLCRLRLHRWGITTYPIGARWCQRCGIKGHDDSGYDPVVMLLADRLDRERNGR